jgi:hypothetical protein
MQIFSYIFCVYVLSITLLFPRALNLDYTNWSDVFAGFCFIVARVLFKQIPTLCSA